MGKPKLVWSPIQLRMANQYKVYTVSILGVIDVGIDGIKTRAYFEVIEILDVLDPYPTLLGIDSAFENNAILNLSRGLCPLNQKRQG